jgi:uncharacterized iron-regulated protein
MMQTLDLSNNRETVVALEMFERDVQPALDRYFALGSGGVTAAAEAEFLAAARPWPNYATDYRPIIEFALLSSEAYASNVPRPIASRVAKEGLGTVLASLPREQSGWLAQSTTAPKDAYWERFVEAMGGGASDPAHGMGMTEEQLYNFYVAQCLKDDTMAETIAQLREEDPTRQVVHLSGSFHIDYKLGIHPRLLQRRPDDHVVTVAIRPVPALTVEHMEQALGAEPGVADYVVFVEREEPATQ